MEQRCALLVVLAVAFPLPADPAPWPTHDLPRSNPQEQGINEALLDAGDNFIRSNCPTRQSFLVMRNGYLVYERYYGGNRPDRANHVMSISKSFLSALTGIAVEKGFLPGIDVPALSYFPEYDTLPLDPRTRKITVRHLLTMTAGMEWNEGNNGLLSSNNWVLHIITRRQLHEPGEVFNYNTGLTHILSVILARATGRSTNDFARQYLFGPLGISNYRWDRDPQGNYVGGFRMYFTAEDLARFALLHLRGGQWNGAQIVPGHWIDNATALRVRNTTQLDLGDYGFLWWIRRPYEYDLFFASGFGGQHVHVVPGLDLIVVTTATDQNDSREKHVQALNILTRYVIPSVRVEAPSIESVETPAGIGEPLAPFGLFTLRGRNLAYGTLTWGRHLPALPSSMSNSRIRINGLDSILVSASPERVDAFAPPELEPGKGTLEIGNRAGTAQVAVGIEPEAPTLQAVEVDGRLFVAVTDAQGARLAPAGGAGSRCARAGEVLSFYATGLGPTEPAVPRGEWFSAPYPLRKIADLRVSIGDLPARIDFAGMVQPGSYQINCQIPQELAAGEWPVVVEVGGRRSQPGVLLYVE